MFAWIKNNIGKTTLITLIGLLLLLPVLLKPIVKQAILDHSQQYGIKTVQLDQLSISPFSGNLHLGNLKLFTTEFNQQPSDDSSEIKPIAKIELLKVDLSLLKLFSKQVHIEQLTFSGANLPIKIDNDNRVLLADIPLTELKSAAPTEETEGEQIQFGIDELNFANIQASLDYKGQTTQLNIENLSLENLHSWSEDYSRLILDAKLNQQPLSANLQLHLFKEMPKVVGTFSAANINSADFEHLLPELEFEFKAQLNTNITFTAEQTATGFKLYQQGQIELNQIAFNQAELATSLNQISWKGDLHLTQEKTLEMTLDGDLKLNNANIKQAELQVKAPSISLATKAKIELIDQQTKITHQGDLKVNGIDVQQNQLQAAVKSIGSKGSAHIKLADNQVIELDQKLNLTGLLIQDPEQKLKLQSDLQIDTSNQITLEKESIVVSHNGSVKLNKLKANQDVLQATLDSINWQGSAQIQQQKTTKITAKGKVDLAELKLLNAEQQQGIANIKNLNIASLKLKDNNQINLEQLKITGLVAGNHGAPKPLTKLQEINLNSLLFTPAAGTKKPIQLQLGKLQLNGSESHITLSPDNKILELESILAGLSGQATTTTENDAASTKNDQKANKQTSKARKSDSNSDLSSDDSGLNYAIESIEINGNNPVHITAQTVKPPIVKTIQLEAFKLGAINSQTPNQTSNYQIKMRFDEFSQLLSKGSMAVLNPKYALNAETEINEFSLVDISHLSENSIGYQIKSGQLSGTLKTKINNNKIDATNKLVINKLEVKPGSSKQAQKRQAEFPVPLETGLTMIKDKQDNIDLSIPIKGDLNSPDFDINDVINAALGKAMAGATRTYLLFALQPFGALALAGEMIVDKAGAISLESVEFKPASTEIDVKMQSYLAKISKILKERKNLQIKLCGGVSRSELEALQKLAKQNQQASKQPADNDQQLLALAKERQLTIKRALIKLGVAGRQLVICKPSIKKADHEPAVDLKI